VHNDKFGSFSRLLIEGTRAIDSRNPNLLDKAVEEFLESAGAIGVVLFKWWGSGGSLPRILYQVVTSGEKSDFDIICKETLLHQLGVTFEGEKDGKGGMFVISCESSICTSGRDCRFVAATQSEGEARIGGVFIFPVLRLPAPDELPFLEHVLTLIRLLTGITPAARFERKRMAQLAVLSDINARIGVEPDLKGLLENLTESIVKNFQYYYAAIFLVDKDPGELYLLDQAGGDDTGVATGYRQPIDIGILGWCARNRQTYVTRDAGNDPFYYNKPFNNINSELCVPIKIDGEVIGLLDIQSRMLGAFDEQDVLLIETLCNRFAAAFANARLYTELKQRADRLLALERIAQSANSSLSIKAKIKVIADRMREVLDVEMVALLERNGDSALLTVPAAVFEDGKKEPGLLTGLLLTPNNDAYIENVFSSGLPYSRSLLEETGAGVSLDPGTEQPVSRPPEEGSSAGESDISGLLEPKLQEAGMKSVLLLPLKFEDRIVGMLLTARSSERMFDVREIEFLGQISSHLAPSLENDRLLQHLRDSLLEVQKGHYRMGLLQELTNSLLVDKDIDVLLENICSQVSDLLDASFAVLFTEEDTFLDIRSGSALSSDFIKAIRKDKLEKPGQGLIGLTYSTGKAKVSSNIFRDHRMEYWLEQTSVRNFKSVAAVPLILREKCEGVLALYFSDAHSFSEQDIRLMKIGAGQAALAIGNARLFNQCEQAYLELSEAQERMLTSSKLTALGTMASGVAHNFNNIISAILLRAQIMKERDDPAQLTKGYELIEQACLDGAAMIKRIQDFGKSEDRSGQFEQFNLDEIVEGALDLTKNKWKDEAQRKGSPVSVSFKNRSGAKITGDSSEIRAVLVNLLLNAIDAMPEGGEITVETIGSSDGTIRCIVKDTGQGMDEEIASRIFDPFFTTKGTDGLGLGLSEAYVAIKRHGGEIKCDSIPGEGSVFTLVFPPIEPAISSKTKIKKRKIASPPTSNILIVENEESMLYLMRDIFTGEGHHVKTAKNGFGGLTKFESGRFDIVFTDLSMDGMSGWELTEKIREHDKTVVVVFVTGWSKEISTEQMQKAGADFLLSKPFRIEDALAVLTRALVLRMRRLA